MNVIYSSSEPLVSVVIPIYNVRRFINRGIKDVLAQTYKNLEIILSDDGSTDGSYEECKKWTEKDSRIKVVHQENKGAGAARNHGIESAKGDFIYFFDIDDEIDPRLLEYCVETMEEQNVDFICFGYNNVETTYTSRITVSFPEVRTSSNNELRDIFVDQFVLKVNGFPWNKFYRKSFLDKYSLRYEDQRIQQDEVFNLKCYRYLDRAYLSPKVLYTYYIYEKGNTRSYFIPDRFDIYKSVRQHFDALKSFWSLNDHRLVDYLDGRFYRNVLQCIFFNLMHPNCSWNKREKRYELDRIMDDKMTILSFKYADAHYRSLEHCLYRKACRKRNLILIRFCCSFFYWLHTCRKKILYHLNERILS